MRTGVLRSSFRNCALHQSRQRQSSKLFAPPSPRYNQTICSPLAASKSLGNTMTTADPIGLRGELGALFQQAIKTAYPDVVDPVVLMPCGQAKFGDYQCNNAMGLFGKLKGKEGAPKAPRDAANAVLAALPPNELVSETSLAGPGVFRGEWRNQRMRLYGSCREATLPWLPMHWLLASAFRTAPPRPCIGFWPRPHNAPPPMHRLHQHQGIPRPHR